MMFVIFGVKILRLVDIDSCKLTTCWLISHKSGNTEALWCFQNILFFVCLFSKSRQHDIPQQLNQWCEFVGGDLCFSSSSESGTLQETFLKTVIIADLQFLSKAGSVCSFLRLGIPRKKRESYFCNMGYMIFKSQVVSEIRGWSNSASLQMQILEFMCTGFWSSE